MTRQDTEPLSSLTEGLDFAAVCAEAARDDGLFAVFKRDPRYRLVLEHVTADQGARYLDLIRARYPTLLDRIDAFRNNDCIGAPLTADYPGVGTLSPTTLRYVKVLGDLQHYFGPLAGLDIVEIGVGYGGQIATLGPDIIHSVANPIAKLTAALHVYSGNFFEPPVPRSQWDHETLIEAPWNMEDTRAAFRDAEARFRAGTAAA